MSVVKIQAFGGMLPAVNERLLPTPQAAYALNTYLYNGTLIGWRQPKLLFNLQNSTTRAAFRVPVDETNRRIDAPSYWLEFDDVDTKVVRTPVIDDTFKRYYFSSPSEAPSYNTTARIAADATSWLLGVPAPTSAPAVSPAGGTGTGIAAARSYVYTYVTAYGEESAPSPPIVVNGYLDDTWSVQVTAPTANDMGVNRNITIFRLYRTVTATDGTTSFFLVVEQAVTNVTYNDSLPDDTVAESDILPSTTWTPPPVDLEGFVMMANGIIAGFRENEIWFCEPFRPHTFPSVYTLTTEFPIVGLGAIGQTLVVCTKGYPVVITGVAPDSMSQQVIHRSEPCNNSGSIAAAPDGVYYASPNGLQMVTPYGSLSNVTADWIDNWQSDIPQNSLRALAWGYTYFAYGSVFLNTFTGQEDSSEAQTGIVVQSPQTASQKVQPPQGAEITNPAFHYMNAPRDLPIFNLHQDLWTSVPYLIQDQKLYYFDFSASMDGSEHQVYRWKSKIFQDVYKRNYAAMRIWFDLVGTGLTQNTTRNTDAVQTLAADQYGIVRVYAGNAAPLTLLTTREIRTSGELMRIKSGQKYDFWQWEFEGRVEITSMQAATTVKELKNG